MTENLIGKYLKIHLPCITRKLVYYIFSGKETNPLTDGMPSVRKRMKIDEPVIRGLKRYWH